MGNISIVIGSWGSYSVCNERVLGSKWLDLEDFSEQEIDEELDKVANEVTINSNVQIDKQTGEVLSQIEAETPTIDKDYMKMLYVLLDGKLTLNKE